MAVGIIAAITLSRGARTAVVYYDSGWQFEMTLENPLSLDANAVAAAASAP